MVQGKTKNGFRFSVDENKLESRRFIKLLTNLGRLSKNRDTLSEQEQFNLGILEDDYEIFILGEEQQKALIDFCDEKSESGYATTEEVQAVLNEIISEVVKQRAKVKNS